MSGRGWVEREAQVPKRDLEAEGIPSDFRRQLAMVLPEMAASAYEESQHLAILDKEGSPHPPQNYLGVCETFAKFKSEFLPLCPITDVLGRKIFIRRNNFPKLLNLRMARNAAPRKAHTILEEIEAGTFVEGDYVWEQDRLQALFWIPDMISKPDAIYKKRRGFGVVDAEEVYLKVYKKQGSPMKVLFTQRVGPKRDRIVITSYVTSRSSAKLYTDGEPLYAVAKK